MQEKKKKIIINGQYKNRSIHRIIEQFIKYFRLPDNIKDTAQFALARVMVTLISVLYGIIRQDETQTVIPGRASYYPIWSR